MPAIQTKALTKTYRYTEQRPGLGGAVRGLFRPDRRERVAVDALDLTVPSGQVIGLLGPARSRCCGGTSRRTTHC
jgi:ABC-2 type transport system ATP-binding protein